MTSTKLRCISSLLPKVNTESFKNGFMNTLNFKYKLAISYLYYVTLNLEALVRMPGYPELFIVIEAANLSASAL